MPDDVAAVATARLRAGAGRIAREERLHLVVLFGSTATGARRPDSDLDLALRADRPLDLVALTNRFIVALGEQGVDLVDLRRADPVLLALVARDGIPLYQAQPGAFASFTSLAARRFTDTRKSRDAEQDGLAAFSRRVTGAPVTELDAALIRRKLERIRRNLGDLTTVADLTLEEFQRDRFRQKGVERVLQEVIESAVDTNLHLVRTAGHSAPGDYCVSFLEAGRHGVIPAELARSLAPAAGLRNRLVHEYDALDDAIVLAAVGEACRGFTAYVAAVERYLERQPRTGEA